MPRVLSASEVEDFRDRLTDAAERLFGRHGPERMTMRHVAAELGVSPMTPYRYFKDKDDILAAVRTRAFNRMADAVEKAFAGAADPVARSREVGRAYVTFALEHQHAYRLMFDLSQSTEADYPDLVAACARARGMMTRHAADLIAAELIAGEPEMVAHMLWSALHGAVVLQLAGKLSPQIDPTALRREIFATLLRGLGLDLESSRHLRPGSQAPSGRVTPTATRSPTRRTPRP